MGIQTFKTPAGDEMVILTRAEYDALLAAAGPYDEDADDVAIFDTRMTDLAAGKDGPLPPEVSALVLRGSSPLKAIRKWRGLSQQELASRGGIGQGYLSDIEGGKKAGALETLGALASALDIPVVWIS